MAIERKYGLAIGTLADNLRAKQPLLADALDSIQSVVNDLFRHVSELSANNLATLEGNIGIGTESPQRQLHLVRSDFGEILIESTNLLDTAATGRAWGISNATGLLLIRATNSTVTTINLAIAILPANGYVGIGTYTPTSPLQVIGIPVYANNAAAVTGGLTAGALYRNNADPDHVCVVH